MPQALEQARAILADPAAHADRPTLRRLAALVALSAEGHAPRQITREGRA